MDHVGRLILEAARGAGVLALTLVVTACSTSTTPSGKEERRAEGRPAKVTITPSDGTGDVEPDTPVIVAAQHGRLTEVTVTGGDGALKGVLSADGTRWRSLGVASPGASYSVRVKATGQDGTVTETVSRFSIVKAEKTFSIESITPHADYTGLTVGVGMPIMITFDQDIADRVSVERNLIVQTSKPVLGAWHWYDDRTVHFRPKEFWPARTKVRLVAKLAGVRGGEGMYGKKNYTLEFKIGRSQITKGRIDRHHMQVWRDGKMIRDIPFSAGRGGVMKYHTTSGIHLAMSREPVTIMTSPDAGPGDPGYYRLTVYNTVRISNSGEYIHGAPWSVGSQGRANVSHGCVNVSPGNAKWFLDNTLIGDPIILTGSPRRLEPLNGWGQWQQSWREWLRWSSLGFGLTTDPLNSA
ncbi:Lipoprotein-anchoring transpeptidase ErfK/SrfK [Thermostaphylospora chromogena]|uniref:Lipoprotein-anchoring transpeptidase ErfK/SrfK n=1 Tax=Thermostaphylospora chromogena TaxID=35622 RepID=A0A1H1G4J9_9ACTN|nr:Lipoprotein-anchoring transpeptidase ErfK/SrfK [Thermostaphylospora chromogena]